MNPKFRLSTNKNYLKMTKNGFLQIDFAFVVLIFFLLFYLTYVFYDSYNQNLAEDLESKMMMADSIDICNLLVSTSGYPKNWENNLNTLSSLGLKNESSNYIDPNKLSKFNSTNYFTLIDKLNLNGSYVSLKLVGLKTNNTYLNFAEYTLFTNYYTYQCYSNYNNEEVKLEVIIWK